MSSLLKRTADGVENASALLVGPRGSGKHRLLSSVLRQLREGGEGEPADARPIEFVTVDLHPLLVPDEASALAAVRRDRGLRRTSARLTDDAGHSSQIAAQLEVVLPGRQSSFCDGLRYLLHLLRRTRPGLDGDAAVEWQAAPVVFILHDFELFARRPKQTLLCVEIVMCIVSRRGLHRTAGTRLTGTSWLAS